MNVIVEIVHARNEAYFMVLFEDMSFVCFDCVEDSSDIVLGLYCDVIECYYR